MSAALPGPVMVAAGCGGTGRELAAYCGPDGLDGLDFVTRSITLDARTGGPGPRVEEVPGGLVNAVGLPNPGLEHFLATELPWLVRAGARVIVSIAGATMGEYADLARRLSRAPGVAGLEVNVGAPDEAGAGLVARAGTLDDARHVGPHLGEDGAVGRELAPDRGDDAGGVVGLANLEELGAHLVRGPDVDLQARDSGRPAEAARQVGVLPHGGAGDRHDHACAGAHEPRQLGGEEVLESRVGEADGVDQPTGHLHHARPRAARARVEGDRAGHEVQAVQAVGTAEGLQLATGAAAARGDHDRPRDQ